MTENTIDNLSIQVVASAERAISTFNRLASGASGLRGAARGAAGGMQDMAQGARDAGTATQEAGTQAGSATISVGRFWNALRGVGSRIGGFFVQAVHRGTAAVGTFLKSIVRIAFYRVIRSIIKDLGQSFKDLYGYSRLFGTDFAKSIDRITTASVYLRNSFAAMVAPLVNMFAPALDMLADKIVDILNFVNQLFAAINGQETYTVAKKVATTWESTFDSAANHATKRIKEVRNTLLGFDEINRLNGETPTTSGSTGSSPYTPGYSTMFEEKPLEGFFKKISDFTSGMPDWLKWLFGGTALVGGFLLIKKFIPWLLKKIGELFAFKIPDWIKWLFGPKGDGDGGLDIPKDIDLPDGEITVDLKQGDWSVLNDITGKDLPVNIVPSQSAKSLFDTLVNAWNNIDGKVLYITIMFTQKATYLFTTLVNAWNDIPGKTLFVNVALSQKATYLWETLQSAWDGIQNKVLYADVMLSQKANYLWTTLSNAWDGIQNKVLYVEVMLSQKATYLWTTLQSAWDNIQNKVLYANVSLSQKATYLWDTLKNAWNGIQNKVVYANVSLSQSANYLWTTLKNAWDGIQNKVFYVEVELKKKGWTTVTDFVDDSFGGATGGGGKTSGGGAGRTYSITADIVKGKAWASTIGGTIPYLELNDLTTSITTSLKKVSEWKTQGIGKYLGITTKTPKVNVDLKKKWGNQDPVDYLKLSGLSTSIKVGLKSDGSKLKVRVSKGTATIESAKRRTENVEQPKALGGVFSNGRWSRIPQYAGGTMNAHGSLFLAGEAGPEIVGHVGGRTEVLNKSQLASAMFSAVQAAMAPAAANFASAAQSMGVESVGFDLETLAEMVRQGVEQAMGRQNELDRQRNEYLRQINEKDYAPEISTSSINKAQQRMNRRAGTTIVPVGT